MKLNELINYLFSNIAVIVRDDGLLSPDTLDQDGVFSGYFYSLNRNTTIQGFTKHEKIRLRRIIWEKNNEKNTVC